MAMIGHMETEAGTCTGIEVIPTEDGPIKAACLCWQCTGAEPPAVAKRYVRPGFTAAMLREIEDEEF